MATIPASETPSVYVFKTDDDSSSAVLDLVGSYFLLDGGAQPIGLLEHMGSPKAVIASAPTATALANAKTLQQKSTVAVVGPVPKSMHTDFKFRDPAIANPKLEPIVLFKDPSNGRLECFVLAGDAKDVAALEKAVESNNTDEINKAAAAHSTVLLLVWIPRDPQLPVKRILHGGAASLARVMGGVEKARASDATCVHSAVVLSADAGKKAPPAPAAPRRPAAAAPTSTARPGVRAGAAAPSAASRPSSTRAAPSAAARPAASSRPAAAPASSRAAPAARPASNRPTPTTTRTVASPARPSAAPRSAVTPTRPSTAAPARRSAAPSATATNAARRPAAGEEVAQRRNVGTVQGAAASRAAGAVRGAAAAAATAGARKPSGGAAAPAPRPGQGSSSATAESATPGSVVRQTIEDGPAIPVAEPDLAPVAVPSPVAPSAPAADSFPIAAPEVPVEHPEPSAPSAEPEVPVVAVTAPEPEPALPAVHDEPAPAPAEPTVPAVSPDEPAPAEPSSPAVAPLYPQLPAEPELPAEEVLQPAEPTPAPAPVEPSPVSPAADPAGIDVSSGDIVVPSPAVEPVVPSEPSAPVEPTEPEVLPEFKEPLHPQPVGEDGLLDELEEPPRLMRISMDTDQLEAALAGVDLNATANSAVSNESQADLLGTPSGVPHTPQPTQCQSHDDTHEAHRKISQQIEADLLSGVSAPFTAGLASTIVDAGVAEGATMAVDDLLQMASRKLSDASQQLMSHRSKTYENGADGGVREMAFEETDPVLDSVLDTISAQSAAHDSSHHSHNGDGGHVNGHAPTASDVAAAASALLDFSDHPGAPQHLPAPAGRATAKVVTRLTRPVYLDLCYVPAVNGKCALADEAAATEYFTSVRSANYILPSTDVSTAVLKGWLAGKAAWGNNEVKTLLLPTVSHVNLQAFETENGEEMERLGATIAPALERSVIRVASEAGEEVFNVKKLAL